MPRLKINYANTKIYKLVCRDITVSEIYVGHTTDFTNRKSKHKNNCINIRHKEYNFKVYQYMRENGGFLNWQMVEIEKFPCLDEIEACKRERYWIETLKSSLNSNIPGRTQQEHYEENKVAILAQKRQYYKDNKETILAHIRQYCEENKESIAISKKKYAEEHKEEYAIYQKKYREEHKEHIKADKKRYNEEHNEKEVCGCGGTYKIIRKSSHIKSKRHLAYILNNDTEPL
jgi:hypothetical protein